MGIIAPKEPIRTPKILLTFLVIIVSPLLIIAIILYLVWGVILYLAIWLRWRKQVVIFVYSDSPTWKDYVEREILPPIQDQAVILNWSERRNWKNSLAVLAFRYFGGYRNFNPMAIVFRPFRLVETYRFFEAFKHGKVKRVEEIKRKLFEDLRV